MKLYYLLLLHLINYVAGSSGQLCYGSNNLDQSTTLTCMTNSRVASVASKQSCVRELLVNNGGVTCQSSGGCMQANIKLNEGSFNNTDHIVWSFLSCHQTNLDIRICSSQSDAITSTAAASTTQRQVTTTNQVTSSLHTTTAIEDKTVSHFSTITESSVSDESNTPTDLSDIETTSNSVSTLTQTTTFNITVSTGRETQNTTVSVEEEDITATISLQKTSETADMQSSTKSSTINKPARPAYFKSCLTGNVQLPPICSSVTREIQLYDEFYQYSGILQVVACCNDMLSCDEFTTTPTDQIECRFGQNDNVVQTNCDTCWAYLLIKNGQVTTWYGCLADIPLSDSSFYSLSTCTEVYRQGACSDTAGGSVEECIRCCDTTNCNDEFHEKIDIFRPPSFSSVRCCGSQITFFLLALSLAIAAVL